jgi:hypothetical protein
VIVLVVIWGAPFVGGGRWGEADLMEPTVVTRQWGVNDCIFGVVDLTAAHRQCHVSYRDPVPTTARKTPQRTVGIDDELWQAALVIASKRREKVSEVLRRKLADYVDEHKDLLDRS